ANLLLGRALERHKELAIRAALGSGRGRLMRQLLTESVLLSSCGAVVGMLIAFGCIRYIRTASPIDLPPGNPIPVDGPVLIFTTVLAVLTGLLFGIMPAWKASRLDLNEVLKEALVVAVDMNGSPKSIEELNSLPIRTVGNTTIYIRDVAHVCDGFPPQ